MNLGVFDQQLIIESHEGSLILILTKSVSKPGEENYLFIVTLLMLTHRNLSKSLKLIELANRCD